MVFNTIGSFLNRIKDSVEIQENIEYKRVTIKTNHKGVKLRNKALGSTIGTKKQFKIKSGDFILSKIDARYGAFGIIPENLNDAIITGNFWTYEVNTKLVDIEWFFYFTHSSEFIRICKESSTGTTHRKYLNEKIFLQHKIYLPNKLVQTELVKDYKKVLKRGDVLNSEIQTQKQLISQLKQAILKEAIQGKLSQGWREENTNVEPASKLLERIKEEKEQLIKVKKIKKGKTLPPITEEEIPFEIPENWSWCRLGELIHISSGDGLTSKEMINGEFPVFGGNGITGYHNAYNSDERIVTIGRVGAYCGAIHLTPKFSWITDNCFKVFFDNNCIYLKYLIWFLKYMNLGSKSYDASQPVISGKRIYPLLAFLPPYDEQKSIVEKIENLMEKCDKIETEIIQNEQHANMLMQAVLKEAFENKTEKII